LGTEARLVTSYGLRQLGLNRLDAFVQNGQSRFNLPFVSVGGVKFSERTVPCPLSQQESNVIWVETSGLLETGSSPQSQFGFSGQIRFKRIEPYRSPSGSLPLGGSLKNALQFPITAKLASDMPAGSKLELSGNSGLNIYQQGAGKTLSLVIQKLPGANQIAVEVAHGEHYTGGLGYQYAYHPQLEFGAFGQYILDKLNLLQWFAPISGGIKAQKQQTNKTIKQAVFDLSNPQQAQAYESLFTQLTLSDTEVFAATESESSYDIDASAAIGDIPVTFLHIAESEKTTHQASAEFQETKSIYERMSKWFSKFSVIWEWISNSRNSFSHLTFDSPYASDFFDITDSLKIPVLTQAREILIASPETKFHADIFFTESGMKKIQSCSFDQAFEAYLGESSSTDTKRYGEIQNKWFFTRWYFLFERWDLEKANPDFLKNADRIAAAYAFAGKIHPFKGSLGRFSDMKSIATLMKLAGPTGTKIHELSVIGPGIALSTPDEGEISRQSLTLSSSPTEDSDRASELEAHS
jgi:hypothetical protein